MSLSLGLSISSLKRTNTSSTGGSTASSDSESDASSITSTPRLPIQIRNNQTNIGHIRNNNTRQSSSISSGFYDERRNDDRLKYTTLQAFALAGLPPPPPPPPKPREIGAIEPVAIAIAVADAGGGGGGPAERDAQAAAAAAAAAATAAIAEEFRKATYWASQPIKGGSILAWEEERRAAISEAYVSMRRALQLPQANAMWKATKNGNSTTKNEKGKGGGKKKEKTTSSKTILDEENINNDKDVDDVDTIESDDENIIDDEDQEDQEDIESSTSIQPPLPPSYDKLRWDVQPFTKTIGTSALPGHSGSYSMKGSKGGGASFRAFIKTVSLPPSLVLNQESAILMPIGGGCRGQSAQFIPKISENYATIGKLARDSLEAFELQRAHKKAKKQAESLLDLGPHGRNNINRLKNHQQPVQLSWRPIVQAAQLNFIAASVKGEAPLYTSTGQIILTGSKGAAAATAVSDALAAAAIAQAHVKRTEASTSLVSTDQQVPSHVQAIMKSKFEAASRLRQTARQQDAWSMALAGAWASPSACMLYAPAALNRRLAEIFYIARENRLRGSTNLLRGLHFIHLPRLESGIHRVIEDTMNLAEKELFSDSTSTPIDLPSFATSSFPWPGTPEAIMLDAAAAFKTAGVKKSKTSS